MGGDRNTGVVGSRVARVEGDGRARRGRRWLLAVVAAMAVVSAGVGVAVPAQAAADGGAFVSTWNTDPTGAGGAGNTELTLPLVDDGTYNFTVNWGDSKTSQVTSPTDPDRIHTYASAGTYSVSITGTFDGWQSGGLPAAGKLLTISSWGPMKLGNHGSYFRSATNLTSLPAAAPDLSATSNLSDMFAGASKLNQDISNWDTSHITDMSGMFAMAWSFNQPVGGWDTGNVANMSGMFSYSRFNQAIGGWDTSKVTDMSDMFSESRFNQPIGAWNTSKVTDMSDMFSYNTAFNQDISHWNTSSVTDLSYMFDGVGLSTANYDALLTGWSARTLQPNVSFSAGGSIYSAGAPATARQHMIDAFRWTITDGGQAPTSKPSAPAAPTGVAGDGQVALSWLAPGANGSPITDYLVQYRPAGSTGAWTSLAHAASPVTSTTVTGLSNGTGYVFQVAAVNGIGQGAWSADSGAVVPKGAQTITFTQPGDVVFGSGDAPLSASASSGLPVTLASTTPAVCTINAGKAQLVGTGTCTITAGQAGSAAFNPAVAVQRSFQVTPAAARTPVLGSVTRTPGGFRVTVTNFDPAWTWTTQAAAPATATIDGSGVVTVSGLAAGQVASVSVKATRTGYADGSAATNGSAQASPAAPGQPAGAAGDGRLGLSWTAPADDGGSAITGYQVQVKAVNGVWADVADADGNGADLFATVTGLSNGTGYVFRISALSGIGQGAWSADSAVLTPVAPAPVQPPAPTPVMVDQHVAGGVPAKLKRNTRKPISLPRSTDGGQGVGWSSATPKICKVVKGKLRLTGKKGVCRIVGSAASTAQRNALRQLYAIRVR